MGRLFLFTTLFVPLLALAGAQTQSADPPSYQKVQFKSATSLPFRPNARDLVAIEVMIDGKGPYLFGIDTCAGGGGRISSDLAKKLGLETIGQARAGDGTGVNMRTIDIRRAGTLTIGGVSFQGVDLLERDNLTPAAPSTGKAPQVDGILGFGLFKELLLKIDFKKHRVTLSQGAVPAGSRTVPLDDSRGVSQVQITIGSLTRSAHFDTGADGEIVIPAADAKQLQFASEPKEIHRARTNFNEIIILGAPLKGDVSLGPLKLHNPLIGYADLFRTVNFGRKMMQGHAFTFDRANKRLKID